MLCTCWTYLAQPTVYNPTNIGLTLKLRLIFRTKYAKEMKIRYTFLCNIISPFQFYPEMLEFYSQIALSIGLPQYTHVSGSIYLNCIFNYSRLAVVWIPLQLAPIVQTSFGLTLVLLAWCLVEIVRYSYYATNLINVNIGILTWLRYTLFIILYPMGVTGEVWCYVDSLAYWKTSKAYSYDMPNTLNFTFQPYVVTLLVILFYLPGEK